MPLKVKSRTTFIVLKTNSTHTGVFFVDCSGITNLPGCKLRIADQTDATKFITTGLAKIGPSAGHYVANFDATQMSTTFGNEIVSGTSILISITVTLEQTAGGTTETANFDAEMGSTILIIDPN